MTDEPLVGRRIDRAAIANLFDEGARLVSIVGPGGMGKTRLARAVAQAFDETDDGRSWFVDLTSVTTSSGLASTIATAIGVRLARDPIADLGRALHRRGRLLLVLDNFEQLVADGARAVGALVAAAPRARMLVTTRLALDLPGEYRWPLAGLEIAAPGAPALLAVESVDLFVRRARQMRPDLPLDDDTLAAIAAIGAKLEGIPLAIELAAARTSALSPAEIRDRLASHEDVLVRRRDAGRHGSMRAVVAGSFRLLADAERACLLACAVFDAGFTLDAADAVLGAPALACLEALVAHSLVRRGAERFHLYEVIREFALGEIDDALLVELQARHAAHFARVAGHARAEDLHDLLRAHAHAIGAHDGEAARALARAAAPILFTRGLLVKRLELLDETLAIASAPELLVLRGHTHAELGAFEHARRDYETALATGDDALAHVRLGELVEARGDTAAARASYEAALASVANDAAGRPIEAIARAALGHAYRREARLDASEREVLASAAAYRALGDDEGLCAMVFEAAVLSLFRRRYDEARARFDEAEAIARRLGARHREAAIHTARGTMEQELGNVDRARELHEAALETFRDVGSAYHEASTLYYLAGAHLERGQLEDADAIFARALAQVRAIGVPRYEALILGARATLAAHAGRTREAEALLGEADAAALRCASEPALLAALAIHRLSLVSARDRDGAAARARELAAAHDCDDPRFALRAFSLRPISSTARALEIDEGGRAFRLPDADAAVDLARRVPLARILHALAQRRVEVPGDAMRVEDLLAAGWPGERVRYDAGANRVYVALAELRKLGLRDWIVSDAAGWRLATSRPVTLRAT